MKVINTFTELTNNNCKVLVTQSKNQAFLYFELTYMRYIKCSNSEGKIYAYFIKLFSSKRTELQT